jgi:hypothetical protein
MSGNGDFHLPTKTSESAINSPIDLKNWRVPDCENVDLIEHGSSLALYSLVRSTLPAAPATLAQRHPFRAGT